ncbi:MAG: SDR family NAD(P)-dependent oxidoreductase [Candidatus Hermodarchaeota archaeon]
MNKLLIGKYALVTGGGRGIGKAIAIEFAKNGANVAIAARTKKELEQTVSDIENYGAKGLAIQVDLSTIEGVNECVVKYLNNFSRFDILVCNAGISHHSNIIDMSLDEALKLFNLNFICYYALIKLVLPKMIDQGGGKIIMTSSIHGNLVYMPNKVAYSSSKAAVSAMGKCLDMDFSNQNIYVNVVLPGAVETRLLWDAREKGAKHPESHGPEVMAPIYLFLASSILKRPYKGRLIDHYSLFELLNKLRKNFEVEELSFEDLLKSSKERLNKKDYSFFRTNKELVEFMIKYKI